MAPEIPFRRDIDIDYGVAAAVTPLIRRVVARNPSPFTFKGTGTYIVGHGQVAVIDPGPEITGHIEALLGALRGETITHILITHTLCRRPRDGLVDQRHRAARRRHGRLYALAGEAAGAR